MIINGFHACIFTPILVAQGKFNNSSQAYLMLLHFCLKRGDKACLCVHMHGHVHNSMEHLNRLFSMNIVLKVYLILSLCKPKDPLWFLFLHYCCVTKLNEVFLKLVLSSISMESEIQLKVQISVNFCLYCLYTLFYSLLKLLWIHLCLQ